VQTPERPPRSAQRPVVVLLGFMGAGKSVVGATVATALGVPFTDSDAVIEAEQGRPIREIFAADGEPAFRELERRTVARLVGEPVGVLALGGGAAMHPATRALLQLHPLTVHLRVGLARALQRCAGDAARPVLHRPDLADVHRERMRVYNVLARYEIDTDDLDSEQVIRAVLRLVEEPAGEPAG